jgi:uncharacterized protein YkwD
MKQISPNCSRRVGLLLLAGSLICFMMVSGSKPVKAASPKNLLSEISGAAVRMVCESQEQRQAAAELAMVQLINRERAEAGLPVLKPDPALTELAREKSRDMVSCRYFGHLSKRLGSVYDQLQRNAVAYRIVAENLAGAPGYRRAHQVLMKSPAHRENLLNPNFSKIGIGIASGGPYGSIVTQILID